MIGFLLALDRFDTNYGVRFRSFAYITIEGGIKKYLRDHYYPIHISRSIKELIPKFKVVYDNLFDELMRKLKVVKKMLKAHSFY